MSALVMAKRSRSSSCLDDDHEDARPRAESPILSIDDWGNKIWTLDGKYHRLDGPAYEWADGDRLWFVDGKRHRLDGPALEWGSIKEWYVDGELHRLDGPACEYPHGNKYWYLYGQEYTEEQFHAKVALLKKLVGNLKMKRFLRLTRHNRQFAESFYAEGGMGRRWDLASLERTGLAIGSREQ